MVTVSYDPEFKKTISKIQDVRLKERIKKQIARIVSDPNIGKPMRFNRKNTREMYIPPFRLSYCWRESCETIVFLDLYHKDDH